MAQFHRESRVVVWEGHVATPGVERLPEWRHPHYCALSRSPCRTATNHLRDEAFPGRWKDVGGAHPSIYSVAS